MNVENFDHDLLGLRDFARRLEEFIDTEMEFVDGGLVVALSARFGSGKTTFLNMWRDSLEKSDSRKPFVVSLNAWESDYYGDPLFAIVSGMIESIEGKGQSAERLVDAAKDFGWFATAIGGQIAKRVTGIDPVEAGAYAEEKRSERKAHFEDAFSLYKDRKNAMEFLRATLEEFISSSEPKIWFLVDELDRCRPDYAISFLETIKHIFDIKGAVFVLAADRRQLENSARAAFGAELDFDEYYRKFVHREISLPPISSLGYRNLTATYLKFYLENEHSRICYLKLDDAMLGNIRELVRSLELTPRQIQEVFRILGHISSTSAQNRGRLLWCLGFGSLAMACYKVGKPRLFELLGSGNFEPQDAINYIQKTFGVEHAAWWFMLFLTGGGVRIQKGESIEDVIGRAEAASVGGPAVAPGNLMQWQQGWGFGSGHGFGEIYEKIEQLYQWN